MPATIEKTNIQVNEPDASYENYIEFLNEKKIDLRYRNYSCPTDLDFLDEDEEGYIEDEW